MFRFKFLTLLLACVLLNQAAVATSALEGIENHRAMAETCEDSSVRFKVFFQDRLKIRNCEWVGNKATAQRCSIPGVTETCPGTCNEGECGTCADSPIRFRVRWRGRTLFRYCSWVLKKAVGQRCAKPGVAAVCREACGLCE